MITVLVGKSPKTGRAVTLFRKVDNWLRRGSVLLRNSGYRRDAGAYARAWVAATSGQRYVVRFLSEAVQSDRHESTLAAAVSAFGVVAGVFLIQHLSVLALSFVLPLLFAPIVLLLVGALRYDLVGRYLQPTWYGYSPEDHAGEMLAQGSPEDAQHILVLMHDSEHPEALRGGERLELLARVHES